MNTFSQVIKNIYYCIFDSSFKERFRLSPNDFTRDRHLTFDTTVFSILDLTKKSLQIGLNLLSMQLNFQPVTKQAFSLARQKISWAAFKALNEKAIYTFYDHGKIKLFKGKYLLLAMDGSTFYLPNTEELSEYFSKARNKTSESVIARTSILYDVLNKITLDLRLVSYKSSEKEMALEHFKWLVEFQAKVKKKIILLFDRGYPCVGLFLLLKKIGIDFVCCAHSRVNRALIDQLKAVDGPIIASACTKDRRRTARTWLGLEKGVSILDWKCTIRGVKWKKKVLLTSLNDCVKFKRKDIHKLYTKRWGVETAYRTLKIDTLVENFSGKKMIVIFQEVYVAILIQNLARMLENQLHEKQNKKECFLNHREVLGMLKTGLLMILAYGQEFLIKMMSIVKINWERSEPGRKYPRNIIKKAAKDRTRRLCYA